MARGAAALSASPTPARELAREFIAWLSRRPDPALWLAELRTWPSAMGLSEVEMRSLRVEVIRLRSFGDAKRSRGRG